jgi:hypothetical protein
MIKPQRKITIEYIRKKYPNKYKDLTDEQLQIRIDLFYNMAYVTITSSHEKLLKTKYAK